MNQYSASFIPLALKNWTTDCISNFMHECRGVAMLKIGCFQTMPAYSAMQAFSFANRLQ
jgi:hypothetical protein